MPGRQSNGGLPSKKSKSRINNKKRSLNAFAIATKENPEKIKIRQHRLGESEGGNRLSKRAWEEDDDEEGGDDAASSKKPKKNGGKGWSDKLSIDAGSDSEGNEWRMGEVDSDNDSDLDSDEAFGESDEERFEGFAFSGGSGTGKGPSSRSKTGPKDVTLDEDDDGTDASSKSDDDDLGDDAIDLAAMLDATDEGEDARGPKHAVEAKDEEGYESNEEGSDEESEDSDEDSSLSSAEDNDENDPEKIAALQNIIAGLPQADLSKAPPRQRYDGASEYNRPSDFGITPKVKLTLGDLGLSSIKDPYVKKSLKLLSSESTEDMKNKGISRKLEVPLAKRQQDRLDRSAAYEKSKETLDRWTDTVKHNRRAEHLMFPLPDPDAASAKANTRLLANTNSKPLNELEATIQSIMEESGLAIGKRRDEGADTKEFEELEMNKVSMEEVKARRAQLRMARDLLFREEAKAKRIKKIKSKSYRKVHRKQREKEDRINREALIEAGAEPSEDEQELRDRRRAEERMGARHRESKWAKATKQIGRAAWDDDARAGITEMTRREEELRKRVEGRRIRKADDDESMSSMTDSEDEDSQDAGNEERLLRKLEAASSSNAFAETGPGSKLSNMKFMLRAEAFHKKANDETVEQIRRTLAGNESSEEDGEVDDVGRRSFGPGSRVGKEDALPDRPKASQFEEPDGSDNDSNNNVTKFPKQKPLVENAPINNGRQAVSSQHTGQPKKASLEGANAKAAIASSEGGAWSRTASRKDVASVSESRRKKQKLNSMNEVEELDLSNVAVIAMQPKAQKKSRATKSILEVGGSDNEESETEVRLPFAVRDQELIKKAFAGADVVGEFEAEKRQTIKDEDEQIIDNTLPGWGSWVGDGVSKQSKRQNKGRFLTKTEGIKEKDRKDTKLDRVIINERRIKKTVKYLASNLPHPFETRQQYERSLRLPVGPEWTTKETFQEATKPRILMKQGIIAPMSKPLL